MVSTASAVIACWDGSAGGTCNTVKYALAQHKPIFRINPLDRTAEWMKESLKETVL
jgi:hypothetical protein